MLGSRNCSDRAAFGAVLARHDYLGDEQAAMVTRLTTGGERVITVAAFRGPARRRP